MKTRKRITIAVMRFLYAYFLGMGDETVATLSNICRCKTFGRVSAGSQTRAERARVVYRMLKYKVEYDPLSVNEYQKQYEEQQVKYMRKKAAKFGFQLIPA